MATKLMSTVGAPASAAKPHISTLAETRFLAVDGGRIAYDDTGGNGPLILAIPEWAI